MRRYGGEVVGLVVATRPIEAGETLSRSDVELRDWLSSLVPEGACTSLDEILGHEVTVPAAAGAPLTQLNFRDTAQLADIPSGHVAVSVPVTDKLGVSSGIVAGSHVIAYRVQESGTRLVSGDVTVLLAPSTTGALAGRGSLTIAVAAKDVSEVLSASTAGDLRLVVPAEDVKSSGKEEGSSADVPPVTDVPEGRIDGGE